MIARTTSRRNTACLLLLFSLQSWESICWQGGLLKHRLTRNILHRLPRPTLRRHALESNAKSNDIQHSERIEHTRTEEQLDQEILRLTEENNRLREALDRVETENQRLQQDFDNRIILEVFEGESRLKRAIDFANAGASMTLTAENMIGEEAYFSSESMEREECSLDEDSCPIEPQIPFREALRDRAFWLVGLLAMQSCSGFILANNEALLGNHPIIVYFLTMLVGAGGNAGNQASVRVIRGLALGTLNKDTQRQFLVREFKMACALSIILSLTGFIRASVFRTPLPETIAVTTALALIVFSSICLGAVLPLFLKSLGVDPAHSSTTIQVVMDILGVLLCVFVSSIVLDSPLGALLISRLSFGMA